MRPLRIRLAAIAVALPIALPAAAQDITVAGSGGSLAEIITSVFDEPIAQDGINVTAVASSERISALRAMMAAGNPIWDVSELSGSEYPVVSQSGWLEPIDWATFDPDGAIPESERLPDAVPYVSFSVVLGVRTDKLPEGRTMEGWTDFWDAEAFPGPRGLRDTPEQNLEYALLADGVAAEELYSVLATSEGQDRAFAKLDEIKPHVDLWWTSGAQPIQALSDGEVFYTTGFNGRFTVLAGEGVPVEIVWDGGALLKAYLGVIKGTDQKEAAMRYLAYIVTDAERAAEFAMAIPYPGFTNGLYDHIPEDARSDMPTFPANLDVQFVYDDDFWAQNRDVLTERWQGWLLQ